MKLIIAYIQPHRFEAVKNELANHDVTRLTVADVMGYGQQKGHTEVFRGAEYTVHLTKKIRIEIAVNDEFVDATVASICKAAKSGQEGAIGDGKIIIQDIADIIRIRTGEKGADAI